MVVVENAHSTIDACEGTDADIIYERKDRQNLAYMKDKGAKNDVLVLKYVNIYQTFDLKGHQGTVI